MRGGAAHAWAVDLDRAAGVRSTGVRVVPRVRLSEADLLVRHAELSRRSAAARRCPCPAHLDPPRIDRGGVVRVYRDPGVELVPGNGPGTGPRGAATAVPARLEPATEADHERTAALEEHRARELRFSAPLLIFVLLAISASESNRLDMRASRVSTRSPGAPIIRRRRLAAHRPKRAMRGRSRRAADRELSAVRRERRAHPAWRHRILREAHARRVEERVRERGRHRCERLLTGPARQAVAAA